MLRNGLKISTVVSSSRIIVLYGLSKEGYKIEPLFIVSLEIPFKIQIFRFSSEFSLEYFLMGIFK